MVQILTFSLAGTGIPLPASLFEEEEEVVCPSRWPYLDEYDFKDVVPDDTKIHGWLFKDWEVLLSMCSRDDILGIFKHLPPEADQVEDRTRTVYWELPIMLDTGTSSYADTSKRISHMNSHIDAEKFVYVGDMQTFFRDSFYHVKFPHHFPNNVSAAGELHGRFHVQHADLRTNRLLVYIPIFMHFGIKGLTSDKLNMKMYSTLERWTFLIMAGTLTWLRRVYDDDELKDLRKILRSTRKNLAVCNHLGWMYYYGTFIYGNKKAVRVNDHARLDFMWEYSLMMYARTNKYIYKKGVLLMMKVLRDSEPNVKRILKQWRTYSEHGRPCSGGEIDALRERVCIVHSILILT